MRNMKKFVAALLVLTMVVALFSSALAYKVVPAKAGTYVEFKKSAWGYGKVTNDHGKNKSSVILRKYSIAHVVATKGNWVQVDIPARGNKGRELLWFHKKYTKKTDAVGEWLLYGSGGSNRFKAGNVDFYEGLKGVKIKTTGKANLRAKPGLEGKSQGVVKKGKTLTLTGKYGIDDRFILFVQVKYGKKPYKYISEEYFRFK